MKLGDIVLFRTVKDRAGIKITNDYPGIVYLVHPEETGNPVGITLFYEGQPSRYGKVYYSPVLKENCYTPIQEVKQ